MATGGLKHFTGEVIEDKFLSCSICLEKFKNPKLLPCLHTFCLKCLDDYIRTSTQQGSFPCPSCGQPTQVTHNLAADFKNNFFMNSLLDFFGETSSSHDCSFCSSTGKAEKAITKCIDCSDYLCESCTKGHGMTRLTVKHKLVPIEQLQKSEIHKGVADKAGSPCNDHPEENVRYYCTVCEKPVCIDCKALDHNEHRCLGFGQAAAECKQEMINALGFLDDELQKFENWKSTAKEHSMKIIKSTDLCVKEIEDLLNNTIGALLTLKNETVDQIKAKKSTYLQMLNAEENIVDNCSKQAENLRDYVNNVMKFGNDLECLDIYSSVKTQDMFPCEGRPANKNVYEESSAFFDYNFHTKCNFVTTPCGVTFEYKEGFSFEHKPSFAPFKSPAVTFQNSFSFKSLFKCKKSKNIVSRIPDAFPKFSSSVQTIISGFINKCSEKTKVETNFCKGALQL